MDMKRIAEALAEEGLMVDSSPLPALAAVTVEHLSYNSRFVSPNTLFFCKGLHFRPAYLAQAIENGAVAYIAEEKYPEIRADIAFIQVRDARRAMSVAAMAFYGYPGRELNLIGITGTKGKTTTAYLIKNIIDAQLNQTTAILSSIEIFTGKVSAEAYLTTPESPDLQKYIAQALADGMPYLTMEVSSQAYKMARVYGLRFNTGVFLNIDEDHISDTEHRDFEEYLACKLELIKNSDVAVINGGTREFPRVLAAARAHARQVVTYGFSPRHDYWGENIRKVGNGFSFDVAGPDHYRAGFEIKMIGRFNVENALAAVAVARTLGIGDQAIRSGLANTRVKGRMNLFENNGVSVIVDYAHNYLSFSRLYESVKADFPGRRIVVLFGCPGGKAYGRRRDLGTLTGQNAQYVYLTTDDAQYEDVMQISREIASYIEPFGVPYEIIPDRKTAIATAIRQAEPGDVIILAAKGEELYQKVNGEFVPFESDLVLAQQYLGLL